MTSSVSRRSIAQWIAMVFGGSFLFACEATTTESVLLDDAAEAMSKDLAGKVTAGIRPIENQLIAGQSVEVLFYLSNGTDEAIEVLPWATPLESIISADLFLVSKDGQRQPYIGRLVKRATPTSEDYITIEAGEKRESVINLSLTYDVSDAGEYQIELEPIRLLGPQGSVDTIIVDAVVQVTRQ